ncbi:MAG: hypothetical protein QOC97_1592 [Chloroflexota bacterium]|nr:hypothetical protein [Chloroflexota bacterium]
MPDSRDRDAFLADLRTRLDLPEEMALDILEELAGHIEDAVTELRAAGLSNADAERRAIARLGHPGPLAVDLARARRGRRRLLAALGGGVQALIVEGIRTWLFLALVFFLAAMLAMPAASTLLHLIGRSTSSYFGGPLGSLVTVAAVASGFAYLGWILPARVAGPAVRSVRGVRRPVAVLGLTVGSVLVWSVVSVAMDPVLAVGLPLGPVAFALAALRAPRRPTSRVGIGPALVGAAVLFIPMTLIALATTTESPWGGWTADTSRIGVESAIDSVESTINVDWGFQGVEPGGVTVGIGAAGAALAARLPTLQLEIWPAQVLDGVVRFRSGPLVTQTAATEPVTTFQYSLPRLRDPVTTATFVVGIAPDGRRVVLGTNLDLARTPPWTGTLLEWWTGS